jgi:hypothetical protein
MALGQNVRVKTSVDEKVLDSIVPWYPPPLSLSGQPPRASSELSNKLSDDN